jgi:hypothetical protein
MAIKVTGSDGSGFFQANGSRCLVRNSSGVPYVLARDNTAGGYKITLYKGNSNNPTSFSKVDNTNAPQTNGSEFYGSASMAIDSSDVIHVAFMHDAGKASKLWYVTVSSDTWGTPTTLVSDIGADPTSIANLQTSIAIDSSDVPHIAYTEYQTNMGTDYWTVTYLNKVGGSWNSTYEVEGQANSKQCRFPRIAIDLDDKPVLSYSNETDDDVGTAIGNANNATGFTLQDVDTDHETTSGDNKTSICVDTRGDHWVAYRDESDTYIYIIKHRREDAWTTWETRITESDVGLNPSIMATGEDIAVFYEDENHDVVWQVYNIQSLAAFYNHANADSVSSLNNTSTAIGQSFTGDGNRINQVYWYIAKVGSPTGNAVCKIYAHTGTFGSSGTPTGSALATSRTFDVADLRVGFDSTHSLIPFQFTTPYKTTNGTKYFAVIEYTNGDASNYVQVAYDGSSPTHEGNLANYAGSWTAYAGLDLVFYLYTRSFNGQATLETGTYNNPQVKWGFYSDNNVDGVVNKLSADSYSESNQNTQKSMWGASVFSVSQSFTGDGRFAFRARFWLKKVGSPTGFITARLYAHTGTFGTDSRPTGLGRQTSEINVRAEDLGTSYAWQDFHFEPKQILAEGTKYCIILVYVDGDASNYVDVGADNSSPTHGGNEAYYDTAWNTESGVDLCFQIDTVSIPKTGLGDHTFTDETTWTDVWWGSIYSLISSSKEAYIAGKQEISSSVEAFIEGAVAATPISSNVEAYIEGKQELSSNKEAYLVGKSEISSSKESFIYGRGVSTSNKEAYIRGLDSLASNKQAFIVGKSSISSSVQCYIAGKSEISSSVEAFVAGLDEISSSKEAFIEGMQEIASNIEAYIYGRVEQVSSVEAFMVGLSSISSNQQAYIDGILGITDSVEAFIHGKQAISSNVQAFIEGVVITPISSSKEAFISGKQEISSNKEAFIGGKQETSSSKEAFIDGRGVISDSKEAFIGGKDSISSSKEAFIDAKVEISSSKEGFIAGKQELSSNVQAFIDGQVPATEISSSVQAFIEGVRGRGGPSYPLFRYFDSFFEIEAKAVLGVGSYFSIEGIAGKLEVPQTFSFKPTGAVRTSSLFSIEVKGETTGVTDLSAKAHGKRSEYEWKDRRWKKTEVGVHGRVKSLDQQYDEIMRDAIDFLLLEALK